MATKFILIALVILGSSFSAYQNDSEATAAEKSASGSGIATSRWSHRSKSPYRVMCSNYVSRSSIKHGVGPNNGVRLRFLQNGIDNPDIEDLSIMYDSGSEYRMGHIYGVENTSLPLYVKVTYRAWNTFHAVQNDVVYEFVIYHPGIWDVNIWN